MRPVLVPGTHVLRRDRVDLQVGLGSGAVVVPGPVAPDLTALDGSPQVLTALVRSGLALSDDQALRRLLPGPTALPWQRHTVAAVARRTGEQLPDVVRSRDACTVEVVTFGHPFGRHLAADLTEVCDRSGLRVGRSTAARPSSERLAVRVLVGVGEPCRELLDPWLRDGEPHLLVRLVEGRVVIGPFVVPGRTACLRCIDAYRREEDPAWPLLVEQYARATRSDRADGIPEPVDAALGAVAVGWAAREVATYAEGADPASTSTTITLSPLLDSVDTRRWAAHPHCGCTW